MSERGAKLMKLPIPFRPSSVGGGGVGVGIELVVETEVEGRGGLVVVRDGVDNSTAIDDEATLLVVTNIEDSTEG